MKICIATILLLILSCSVVEARSRTLAETVHTFAESCAFPLLIPIAIWDSVSDGDGRDLPLFMVLSAPFSIASIPFMIVGALAGVVAHPFIEMAEK